MTSHLDHIIHAQKSGEILGIPSICSAHPWVLRAAMQQKGPVLVESTCNQVNQFGGYTGMTPLEFKKYLQNLAHATGFPTNQLILGGDHLGPSPWQKEPASSAMQKSAHLVQAYIEAGFTKIHLDASMKLGDDNLSKPLDSEIAAQRTAFLAKAAETACQSLSRDCKPRYVIGSEVPIPGGATDHEESIRVTCVEDAQQTLELSRMAFFREGLEDAWERVIALVVQPGVEFGDDFVIEYDPFAAQDLATFAETLPIVYEAHSTDYQKPGSLRNLVRDHFAILKVGPALTFAFREAVFSLAMIEDALFPEQECSYLIKVLDTAMLDEPEDWKNHYHGTEQEIAFARKYSLSDRSRYYWTKPSVQSALERMLQNLGKKPIPPTLVSQYLPQLFGDIRAERLPNTAEDIITKNISSVLAQYNLACAGSPEISNND